MKPVLRKIWHGSLMVAGGLLLFSIISYAVLIVFWQGIFFFFPVDIPPQGIPMSAGNVDSTIYYNPQPHGVIRRTTQQ